MKYAALIAAILIVAFASVAQAAKTNATLSASPSSPAVGDSITFSGCGYDAGSVTIVVVAPDGSSAFFGAPVSGGCFDTSVTENYVAWLPGAYKASSYQTNGHKALATAVFIST